MSVPEPRTPSATLTGMIAFLAAVHHEDAAVRVALARIGRLAGRKLARCDAVSVTYAGDDGVTTLEADPELVRAVDAVYGESNGSCLRWLRDRRPSGGRGDASITWPGFRGQYLALGLRSVVAVPLFTAVGPPVASLDVWSRSPVALDPLRAALVVLCDCHNAGTSWGAPAGLGPGERQLAEGLGRALEVRRVINQAVAHLAARHQVSLDDAFEQLCVDARSRGTDIARTARRLLVR
jgi:hypothetical protein